MKKIQDDLPKVFVTDEQKGEIAKMAYKKMKEAIEDLEGNGLNISVHWDECITVEDLLFIGYELKQSQKEN